jgi:hypothetical protein
VDRVTGAADAVISEGQPSLLLLNGAVTFFAMILFLQ